jgi:signal transduction histidine kinase/ActR/RegA family two-component response regulator
MFISVICFLAFFTVAGSAPSPQSVDQNKHVLVINSYHKGYPWTDNTLDGIESVLKDGKRNIELHVEFMDSKRVVDKNHFHRLFLYYRSKFDQVKLDLIIVSDNDAFNFIIRYRDALFPKIPIVFCGVNGLNEMLQQKVRLLTGVVEHYDIKQPWISRLKLHPNVKEIVAVNNGTPIGAVKKQLFSDALAATGKNLVATIIDDPILEDFERLLKDKGKEVIVILLGSFKEKSGAMVPIEVSTPILARYDVPLYGLIEYYLDYGIIGGKLISGYHQGVLAAQMGLKVLQGESIDRIPIERKSPNIYMFDNNQLMKFGVKQELLPEGSIIINRPKTAPRQNNKMVWAVIAVFLCLGIAAVFLILFIRSRRNSEESLERLSVEHQKKIEMRTEELMKSNTDLRQKITEMEQAEAVFAESRLKYMTLFQKTPNPVFVVDEDFHFSDYNEKMIELLECTLDDLRVMDARNFIPENLLAQLFEAQTPSKEIRGFETHLEVNGKTKTLLLNIVTVMLSGKKFVYGVGQEVKELKRGQDILREHEIFLKEVINVLPGSVIIFGRDGIVEYVNEGFLRDFGFSRDNLPTFDVWLLKAYPDKSLRDLVSGAWLHAATAKKFTGESIQTIESRITTGDGSILEKELRFIPVQDAIIIVVNDIPKKKLAEDRTPLSRNQESIETLAAGIAHDFNNLLLVILGNISLIKTSLTQEDKAFDRLIDAERACMMTKDLIQQLITFSKGEKLSKREMAITPLVMEVARSTLSNTNIRGKYIMSDDVFSVEIDEGQIRQVIHIILRNAKEAMTKGGTVTISFENIRIGREDYLPLRNGDYVKVSFQDEGTGIKKEHLERIFDPYFTTKDAGSQKGVGLGLAIAYSIIKNHNGHIAVESSVGGGTTFHIYLPAFGRELIPDKDIMDTSNEIKKKKGKILVMDDAKSVRDVTGAMLTHIGYDVEFAREGREAIALYRASKESNDPFDAVILDLSVQGGMGGREAIELLIAIDPQIKAIISSGFSGDPIMFEYKEYGFKTAILKPYKMEELEQVLERLIRSAD